MKSFLASSARFLLLGAGVVASVATSAVEPGDRSGSNNPNGPDDNCPIGELCSDTTPNGLYFGGMPTGDVGPLLSQWAHPTAVGGTQTVRIFLDSEATVPLDLPFSASLTTDALSIVEQGPNSVTLTANAVGDPKLRITEPGTDLLYDRVTVDSGVVLRMQPVPAGKYMWNDLNLRDDEGVFAILAGKTTRITTQLLTASDLRVVDEGMSFDLSDSVAVDPLGFADTVALTPTAAGVVNFTARSVDQVDLLSVQVVSTADRIEDVNLSDSPSITVGQPAILCFRAKAGEATVVNVDWSYRADGPMSLAQADDDVGSGCIELLGNEAGLATLTVSGAEASDAFQINVIGSDSRSAPGFAPVMERESVGALAGERADQ